MTPRSHDSAEAPDAVWIADTPQGTLVLCQPSESFPSAVHYVKAPKADGGAEGAALSEAELAEMVASFNELQAAAREGGSLRIPANELRTVGERMSATATEILRLRAREAELSYLLAEERNAKANDREPSYHEERLTRENEALSRTLEATCLRMSSELGELRLKLSGADAECDRLRARERRLVEALRVTLNECAKLATPKQLLVIEELRAALEEP